MFTMIRGSIWIVCFLRPFILRLPVIERLASYGHLEYSHPGAPRTVISGAAAEEG